MNQPAFTGINSYLLRASTSLMRSSGRHACYWAASRPRPVASIISDNLDRARQ